MDKIRIQNYNKEGHIINTKVYSIDNFLKKSSDILSRHGFNINIDIINPKLMHKLSKHLRQMCIHLEKENHYANEPQKKFIRHKEPTDSNIDWVDYRQSFIRDVMDKCKNDQDKLIQLLRAEGFVFMDTLTLIDRFPDVKTRISKIRRHRYQWMVKMIKAGVSPDKDKMDPFIIFGMIISPKRKRKTLIFLNKEFIYSQLMDIPRRTDGVKRKPIQLIKYPEQMDYLERNAWGKEHRKLIADPELKPSKFYTIYNQDIEVKGDLIIIGLNNKKLKYLRS